MTRATEKSPLMKWSLDRYHEEIANSRPGRDLGPKRQVYAQVGIQEHWVFNLAKQEINVFRDIQNGDYQVEQTWSSPTISLEAFPELTLETAVLRELAFQDG